MSRPLPNSCDLCPRRCGANRAQGAKGLCGGEGEGILVARAALHQWEEPPISGCNGSGTVFFSGCPLRCCYCQNYCISRGQSGKLIDVPRLSQIFLELQAKGAHNINLVTPTHYRPQILDALDIARAQGLILPIVYNCGGYETVESIKELEGYVDIYLSDFKYHSSQLSSRYSKAADYFPVADAALAAMFAQVGDYRLSDTVLLPADPSDPDDEDLRLMDKGIIMRHLLLPGQLEDSKRLLEHVFLLYGNRICYSLMNQFTPLMPQLQDYPELQRGVGEEEYDELIDFAMDLGIENCFIQEGGAAQESFIPAFDNEGV